MSLLSFIAHFYLVCVVFASVGIIRINVIHSVLQKMADAQKASLRTFSDIQILFYWVICQLLSTAYFLKSSFRQNVCRNIVSVLPTVYFCRQFPIQHLVLSRQDWKKDRIKAWFFPISALASVSTLSQIQHQHQQLNCGRPIATSLLLTGGYHTSIHSQSKLEDLIPHAHVCSLSYFSCPEKLEEPIWACIKCCTVPVCFIGFFNN